MTNTDATYFFLPAELVAQALASLAEQSHDAIDRLSRAPEQGDPSVKDEIKFHLRDYRAYIKAAYHWGRGVRPVLSPTGSWLIPSASSGGVIHEVSRPNGFWQCGPSCLAQQFHWHTALALGIEKALELANDNDDGDPGPGEPPEEQEIDDPYLPTHDDLAARTLGARIARAQMARWAA